MVTTITITVTTESKEPVIRQQTFEIGDKLAPALVARMEAMVIGRPKPYIFICENGHLLESDTFAHEALTLDRAADLSAEHTTAVTIAAIIADDIEADCAICGANLTQIEGQVTDDGPMCLDCIDAIEELDVEEAAIPITNLTFEDRFRRKEVTNVETS
jgi:hypothetical protein